VVRAAALPASAAFFSEWMAAAHIQRQNETGNTPLEPPYLSNYQPKFFSPDDFDALQAFTEILIPTDETPGAREARCACFIDFVLYASTGYAPQTQARWRQALASLKKVGFHSANTTQRAAIIKEISRPERDGSPATPAFAAYQLVKRENAFAFYTSREGMIGCLDYRGNSYNPVFPACNHPEHHVI
jgi:gluconate 2-dehydrogenase subunit 3-like protein